MIGTKSGSFSRKQSGEGGGPGSKICIFSAPTPPMLTVTMHLYIYDLIVAHFSSALCMQDQGRSQELEMGGDKLLGEGSGGR